jgi:hypothetical protein
VDISNISGETTEKEGERDGEVEVVNDVGEGETDWGRVRSNSISLLSS